VAKNNTAKLPATFDKRYWQNGLHIDHVIPIAKGGADILDNLKPSHAICNISKGAKLNS
jgi:5-methylcytosine-specific restriction endonuclease McrA